MTKTTVESNEDDNSNRLPGGEGEVEGEKPTLEGRYNGKQQTVAGSGVPFGFAQTSSHGSKWDKKDIPSKKNGAGNSKTHVVTKVTKT